MLDFNRDVVYPARGWAAPRLEIAADYCTATVAPRVADALRSTARQVSPAETAGRRLSPRTVVSASVLATVVLAAAGAAAVLVRRQYKAAVSEDEAAGADDMTETETAQATEPAVTVPA